MRRSLLIGALVATAVFAGISVLRFVHLEGRLWFGLVPIAPWLCMGAACAAAAFIDRRSVGVVVVASITAIALAMPGPTLPRWGCSVSEAAGVEDVVIYSHNAKVGEVNAEELAGQVESVGADVVVLQEARASFVEQLAPLLDNYPFAVSKGELLILSRWELSEQLAVAGEILGAFDAVVDTPAGQLRVVNVHSPWPLLPVGRSKQVTQFAQLHDVLSSNGEMPVVALGDFNATTADLRYRELASGKAENGSIVDAHGVVGCGFGVTWSPVAGFGPALLGLDHAAVSGAEVEAFEVLGYAGGDHRGIAVRISLSRS